jgi:dipeptidase E
MSALLSMLDAPIASQHIAFIPTAANAEAGDKAWLIKDYQLAKELGPGSIDIVDVAALRTNWQQRLADATIIMVGGGNTFYLSYWMQQSGLLAELPNLLQRRVYMGISAGSMIVGQSLGVSAEALARFGELRDEEYDELGPPGESLSTTARLVPFLVRPHFNSTDFPKINDTVLQNVATKYDVPLYAIDDQTAIKVEDGAITVVSEGEWKLYK